MSKEEIEKQLKLSKRQSKDERYDYLCSEFNGINYCINLEKYTNKLKQENKQLKDNWDELKEYIKETKLKEFEKSYGKRYGKTFTQAEIIVCNMILDKMQELEPI